jgi:hypothetical protein
MIKTKPKGMLTRRHGLGLTSMTRRGAYSSTTNLAFVGAGALLGLVSFPYRESAIGATLVGTAGSLVAIGAALFIRELVLGVA